MRDAQLKEIREMSKKNAGKKKIHEQYQRSRQVLEELKRTGYLNNAEFFTALDKLEANHETD